MLCSSGVCAPAASGRPRACGEITKYLDCPNLFVEGDEQVVMVVPASLLQVVPFRDSAVETAAVSPTVLSVEFTSSLSQAITKPGVMPS